MTTTMQKRAEKLGAIEQLLDHLAKSTATRKGIPFAKAYAELLQTDEGRVAYAQLYELSVDTEREATLPVAPAEGSAAGATLAKARSIDAQLDAMARERASRTYEHPAVAYSKVLETDEGRRLYAEHCELMASVGA